MPVATTILLSRMQEAIDHKAYLSDQKGKWQNRINFIETYFGDIEPIPRTFIIETENRLFTPYITAEDSSNLRLIKKKWIKTNWPKHIGALEEQEEDATKAITYLESRVNNISNYTEPSQKNSKILFDF